VVDGEVIVPPVLIFVLVPLPPSGAIGGGGTMVVGSMAVQLPTAGHGGGTGGTYLELFAFAFWWCNHHAIPPIVAKIPQNCH
jgi:hypothetical protein